ncbi:MAG: hypothetical protein IV100_32420 [Myxococcales bacterium]|nr:hypothetical protein [Myxococcales bacterium]
MRFERGAAGDRALNSSPATDGDDDTSLDSDDGVIRVIDRTGVVKWTYTALTTSIKGTAAIRQWQRAPFTCQSRRSGRGLAAQDR